MREPSLAGRGLGALVLLAPEFGSGVSLPRPLAAGVLWGARSEDAMEEAGDEEDWGGLALVPPYPRRGPNLLLAGGAPTGSC